ncbi:ABC transporter ATP-binding protein [Lactobacillus acetotolerans]|jgi:putative ABC transport system ATP-binding protein|uniref:ATP-binding cassette domain-containing protein n=2 Tax=Lactobacillus acetotolerans TaxID=1600 RepID=A0A5P5ZID9_9LACO|nr:ATP-binding cassette domain-containing protein [Lactobacillus acetotolerans]KRN39403.1 ABC-type transport system, ATPase component [Lactobacillus acetotolerans DSM 20749 = JCM 3825]QFG51179.1 ATP-binding cassette domain-containing protein [Lactobacillus acetotolerans]QJD73486.1 ATP-binding cassette domain-containing protein [Lactobacillus acetotolerans]GGV17161.1 ABC transporter ATP-binding protein [Lactobacillus acetotolerans DSM 20749 = JCM 3825]HBQ43301.1 spermidine/putrescine ABC transp
MNALIELKNVGYQVKDKTILSNINLKINAGTKTTFVGPSGAGKSTLARLIARMISYTSGSITYKGKEITDYEPTLYRRKVSYCFQQPTLFGNTVRDNLNFPFVVRKEKPDQERIIQALKSVNLSANFLDMGVTELSGGERQRVAMLRNIIFHPDILIIDEVSAGLDADNKKIINHLINGINKKGVTILQITHDESEINNAQNIIKMDSGKLVQ